jgi:hypothetical protein
VIDPVASSARPAVAAGGAVPASASAASGSASKPDAVSRGFEQLLVQQLAKELLETTGDTGSQYASLLPSALADAVEDGGGLGLDLGVQGTGS